MSYALVMGTLFKAPEQKTSANGGKYVTATIKCRAVDNRSEFWSVRAFNPAAQDELMRLRENDALSAQGIMSASIWTPEGGEPRISLSLLADNVLPAKARKESKVPSIKPAPSQRVVAFKPTRPVIDDDLNDDPPF